jgi:LacI family transcriptional regulator
MTMRRIAVLIESSRGYGRALLEGIAQVAHQQGDWSIDFQPRGLDSAIPQWLKRWQGDGVIARATDRVSIRALRALRVPVVDLLGSMREDGLADVRADNQAIAAMAASAFADRGLRTFAFCGPLERPPPALLEREACFAEVIAARSDKTTAPEHRNRRGLPYHCFPGGIVSWDRDRAALDRWLNELPKPLGILACHDDRGIQILQSCRRLGIDVPNQVSVIGVDNDALLCQITDPPLSSIDPNGQWIGRLAALRLVQSFSIATASASATTSAIASATAGGSHRVRRTNARIDRTQAFGRKGGGRSPIPLRCGDDHPSSIAPRGLVVRQSSDFTAVSDPLVAACLQQMRVAIATDLTVANLAKRLGLSISGLARRFREQLDCTPKAAFQRMRGELASQLLRDTSLTIEQVASRCGFATDTYFSDAFRKQFGIRPGAYRRGAAAY